MRRARWLRLGAFTLALAAVLHVLTVWLIPVVIMQVFLSRIGQQAGVNRIISAGLPTHTSRSVVKPSPDLLYGVCVYDVSAGPVFVSIKPPSTYWSLSLFNMRTDNYFKINAANQTGDTAQLILGSARDRAAAQRAFPTATFVETPNDKGVMLARILVLDKASMEQALTAQSSVRCESQGARSG